MAHKVSLYPVACLTALIVELAASPAFAAWPSSQRLTNPTSLPQSGQLVAGRLGFTVRGIRPSRHRIGGISRGGTCQAGRSPLRMTALLPESRSATTASNVVAVEATTAAHPAFFAYVPETTAQLAEFTLFDENRNQILYDTTFALPKAPGVIGVQLPDDAPTLEVGSTYYWTMAIVCNPLDRAGDVYVEGWLQRVPLTTRLETQLATAEPRDRPALYAREGLWQDTISALAALRYDAPDDAELTADWMSLLESVNLGNIAQAPLVQVEQDSADALSERNIRK